jgi:hypothetical protein
MILRTDHVAAGAFILIGVLIFALSGDLPTGTLSFPGAGFMPKLIATVTIALGILLVFRGAESEPFANLSWADGVHALRVVATAALAIAAYTTLGFIITMVLMLFALVAVCERRRPVQAALYSLAVVLLAYGVFEKVLKSPLPNGPLGF